MSEWSNEHDWKSCDVNSIRGFESPSLRQVFIVDYNILNVVIRFFTTLNFTLNFVVFCVEKKGNLCVKL